MSKSEVYPEQPGFYIDLIELATGPAVRVLMKFDKSEEAADFYDEIKGGLIQDLTSAMAEHAKLKIEERDYEDEEDSLSDDPKPSPDSGYKASVEDNINKSSEISEEAKKQ